MVRAAGAGSAKTCDSRCTRQVLLLTITILTKIINLKILLLLFPACNCNSDFAAYYTITINSNFFSYLMLVLSGRLL